MKYLKREIILETKRPIYAQMQSKAGRIRSSITQRAKVSVSGLRQRPFSNNRREQSIHSLLKVSSALYISSKHKRKAVD